ncbi:hypothetical protein WJX81_000008 [Elliptochloris bilobata]|uniref:Flagellar associated protein n=1 Tax=Elliptochloris bilobata TaxID=381761 RepID=A0AAW1R3R5_9CHLO
MNNNKADEPALLGHCKGVFAKASYIDVGTKEEPLLYVQHPLQRAACKGKQMQTRPALLGRTPATYFEKQHAYVSEGAPYVDRLKYAERGQERPGRGFNTSDYMRRDEFTMTFRTEQYRTLLKQEAKHARQALTSAGGNVAAIAAPPPPQPPREEVFLFDQVFAALPRSADGGSRLGRDTHNRTALSRARFLGPLVTTSLAAHALPPPQYVHAPQYGHRPKIAHEFYRRDNAFLV